MSNGYIYILSNKSLKKGFLKIGCTERLPELRRKELSRSTSIPLNFSLEHSVQVKDYKVAEKRVHLLLADSRINGDKEFFEIDIDKAKETINSISLYMKNYEYYSEVISSHPDLMPAMYTEEFSLRRGYAFTVVLMSLSINNTLLDRLSRRNRYVVDGFADSGMISELMGMSRRESARLMRIFAKSHINIGLKLSSGGIIGVFDKLVYHRGQMAWSYTDEYLALFYNEKI